MSVDETPPDAAGLRLGVLPSPQFTTWPELQRVATVVDEAGIDELWVSDHLLPPYGRPVGPIFEAFTTLAAWAATTRRVTLGPMVAANRFRPPALLAKQITGIDHVSGGRAVLGLGAGWFEHQHRAFGVPFGTIGERLDALEAACRGARHAAPRRPGRAGRATEPPPPVQHHLPLLVGASGERRGLRLVAQHADVWNTPGPLADVSRSSTCCTAGASRSAATRPGSSWSTTSGRCCCATAPTPPRGARRSGSASTPPASTGSPGRRAGRRGARPLRRARLPQLLRRPAGALRRRDDPPPRRRGRAAARRSALPVRHAHHVPGG